MNRMTRKFWLSEEMISIALPQTKQLNMKEESYIHDEEKISDIIESHRKNVFEYAQQQMFMAFDEIWAILQEHGLWGISKKKVNGIQTSTLKNIYMRLICGDDLRSAPEETIKLWLVEFLKAQTLSYEVQRAQFPNFLKPWTKEDETTLEMLWCDGETKEQIAIKLGRHPNSVAARLTKLGIE